MNRKNLLSTKKGRLLTFSMLYLTEGIPLGFSAIAIATNLRMSGADIAVVGTFIASLYAPWGFKWAWAPLVDLLRFRRFGSSRTWIAGSQILMILTLGLLFFFDLKENIGLLIILMVVHNIFAATMDVAIDALAVRILPADERGIANGFMFGAAYLGQTVGGSGALLISSIFGFQATFPYVLSAIALILIFITLRIEAPEIEEEETDEKIITQITNRLGFFLKELFQGFFRSGKGPVYGVLFAFLPSGALALGLGLGSTLQVDVGMTQTQIATISFISTVLAAAGCISGGWISDRIGHRKALGFWYVLTIIPTLYIATRFTGPTTAGLTIAMFIAGSLAYSFTSGLIQGTRTALYMGLTNPKVAGTQFTGYMALSNLVYTYTSFWQGRMAEAQGYQSTMFLDSTLVLIPLVVIPFLVASTRANR